MRAAASVVIIPRIPAKVVAAAFQCVPAEVLLRVDDTPETLKTRLSASPFLDDAHVLNPWEGGEMAVGWVGRWLWCGVVWCDVMWCGVV